MLPSPPTSLLSLSILLLLPTLVLSSPVSAAAAAPAITTYTPASIPNPQPPTAQLSIAGFDDPACFLATTSIACGYVDPAWTIAPSNANPKSKRRISLSSASDILPPPLPPAITTLLRVNNPLMSAISALGGSSVLTTTTTQLIVNLLPLSNQGAVVQGLAGELNTAVTYDGVVFPQASSWVIRWDFSWWQAGGVMPPSGVLGPHVEFLLQNGEVARKAAAFYFEVGAPIYAEPQMGNAYYGEVLNGLMTESGYTGVGSMLQTSGMEMKLAMAWGAQWDAWSKAGGN